MTTCPAKYWHIGDEVDLKFFKRKLSNKPCCLVVFSTEELALDYIGKLPSEFFPLVPYQCTWDDLINRFYPKGIRNILLDHEIGSAEGNIIPLERTKNI